MRKKAANGHGALKGGRQDAHKKPEGFLALCIAAAYINSARKGKPTAFNFVPSRIQMYKYVYTSYIYAYAFVQV